MAKANACLSTMKNIGNAFVFYLNENRDTFPPGRLTRGHPSDGPDMPFVNEYFRESPRWQWFLEMDQGPVINPKNFPHLRKGQPWGVSGPYGDDNPRARRMTVDTFRCPSLDDPDFENDIRDGAYGYNYQYLGNARRDSDSDLWDNFAVLLHQIKSPAKTVVVADSRGAGRRHGVRSFALDPPRLATEKNAKRFGPEPGDGESAPVGANGNSIPDEFLYSPVEARHKGRGNVIFVDGHGEGQTLTQLGYARDETNPNIVVPVRTKDDPGEWNNKMWTGTGRDPFAERRMTGGG